MTQPYECEVRFGIDDIEDKHGKGAYTESIVIGPEYNEIPIPFKRKQRLLFRRLSWPIQPDIVKEHLT